MINNQRGSASLEFLIVFIPWLIVIFIFLNLVFLLGSLMNNQATLTRGVQQIAAAGCLPDGLTEQIEKNTIGTRNLEINTRSFTDWSGSGAEFSASGELQGGKVIESCAADPQSVPGGNYVYLQLNYDQYLPMLDALTGFNDGGFMGFKVRRGALLVSQSLESRE